MSTYLRRILALLALCLATSMFYSCRRAPEQSYAGMMESGRRYLDGKEYVKAIIQFKNAIRMEPRNAEGYYRLGLACVATSNMLEAVPALVKAAEIDPNHVGAQLKLAELLAGSADKKLLEEGRKRVQTILSSKPHDSEALTVMALSESRLGETSNAEQHLLEALRESPSSLKASSLLARIKLAQRDAAGAEQVLRAATDQAKGSAPARLVMAEFYLSVGKLTEAEKELRAALGADAKNTRAMLGLAAIYTAAGKKEEAGSIYRQVSAVGDARYRHLYGSYLFNEGKREAAVQEFETQAHRDPADREARSRLVAAYLAVNRGAEAQQLLEGVLKKNPRDADALVQKSEIEIRAGRYGEAEKSLAEVLRSSPESAPAHLLLAKVHQAHGDSRLQRQELSQALQLRPDLIEARLDLARGHLEANSPQSALQLLDQAPASQKQGLTFLILRNHALLALGKDEECARGVGEGLARGRVPDLLVQDAELKLRRKNYAGARTALVEALKGNPEHLGALGLLYRVSASEKGLAAGLEMLREYAASHVKSARVQYYAGERLLVNGKREDARRALNAAKAADSKFLDADMALARLDVIEGNLEAARRRLSTIAAATGEGTTVHLLLASIENAAGNHAAAIEQYRKVLELDANQVLALTNLAYLLGEYAQKADEALPYAQKAKELEPSSADAGGVLGWLYYRKGIYASALVNLKDAVGRDNNAAGSGAAFRRCYLGLTYLKLGDRQRGLNALEQTLQSNPGPREAEAARAAIRTASQTARK
jgi:Tfp pilus assembly protein PilF